MESLRLARERPRAGEHDRTRRCTGRWQSYFGECAAGANPEAFPGIDAGEEWQWQWKPCVPAAGRLESRGVHSKPRTLLSARGARALGRRAKPGCLAAEDGLPVLPPLCEEIRRLGEHNPEKLAVTTS